LVKEVLTKLKEANLTLSPAKCQFGLQETIFVGHKLTATGILPSPEKVAVIENFPRPARVKDVRSWVGLTAWFRRFIPEFSQIVAPLTALTKKDAPWKWTPQCEEAWLHLKRALVSPPILAFPSLDLPFIVMADASAYCIAGVILQDRDQGQRVISYHSRMLNKAECNYSASERETLAIIFVITQNKFLLLGTKFTVVTDHAPLSILTSLKSSTSPRLARWALCLSEYDFVLKHKPGKAMDVPDCLSRPPRQGKADNSDTPLAQINMLTVPADRQELGDFTPLWTPEFIRKHQMADSSICQIIKSLETDPDNESPYALDNQGILYKVADENQRSDAIVVPQNLQAEVLEMFHNNLLTGMHSGGKRTFDKIRSRYYWKGLWVDCQKKAKDCISCAQRKPDTQARPVPLQLFDKFHDCASIDVVGPLPPSQKSGAKYVLTWIKISTRYVELVPMMSVKAEETAEKYVNHIVATHGIDSVLISDRGSNFLSRTFQEVLKILDVKHIPVCSFNPKANGYIERSHATVFNSISHFINKAGNNWEDILHLAKACYNATLSDNLAGYSPHFLQFGGQNFRLPYREILKPRPLCYNLDENVPERLILQWQKAMKLAEAASQEHKEKVIARRNQGVKPVRFKVGDLVYLKNKVLPQNQCKKWNLKFLGPYTILRQLSPVNFEISAVYKKDIQVVNADRLKLSKAAEGPATALARDELNDQIVRKITGEEEKVIDSLGVKCKYQTREMSRAMQDREQELSPAEAPLLSDDEEEIANAHRMVNRQEEGNEDRREEEVILNGREAEARGNGAYSLRNRERVDYSRFF
jgi:hypothetical protein